MNGVRAADREELFISRLFEWGLCSEFSGHIAHEIRFDTTGLTGILNEAEFPFAIEVADFDDFQFPSAISDDTACMETIPTLSVLYKTV